MILSNLKKSKVGILGSGFGLYGYLPAIAAAGNKHVFLLNKNKKKFEQRDELLRFSAAISFAEEEYLLSNVEILIICLTPKAQSCILNKALGYSNISQFILEKPLAQNPQESAILLNNLIGANKIFRVGYNFQYTPWGNNFVKFIKETILPSKLSFKWFFMSNHYAKNLKNWKRFESQGGGVLRFYGVHLLALFCIAEKCSVLRSEVFYKANDDSFRWQATFKLNDLLEVNVDVNSSIDNAKFLIIPEDENSNMSIQLDGPFDECEPTEPLQDSRTGVAQCVIKSLEQTEEQSQWNTLYKKTNLLWAEVEYLNNQERFNRVIF